jgi:2-keto-4-pentenoate hydratase/2-oxohepta-3-ene-1,7-dioic acid hydratase in catechol pathway
MRLANLENRPVILEAGGAIDLVRASDGAFSTNFLDVYSRWEEVRAFAASTTASPAPYDPASLGPPVPLPRQVFGIGLNYKDHAEETGVKVLPPEPLVFTKFPTCHTGPEATVALPSSRVDYEVELVVVIGKQAEHADEADGWDYIAGLTVGNDLSERTVQLAGPVPQFSMGKSYRGFGPMGPAVVSLDEIPDPGNLDIRCQIGDEVLQSGSTKNLIFSAPALVSKLSQVCPLLPGDVIWTGTPAGVGMGRRPERMLRPGETLTSTISLIGEINTRLVASPDYIERG